MKAPAQSFTITNKETPVPCPAKQIGSRARVLLGLQGFSGKVLAVLSNAIYLVGSDEEILWVAREALPMHSRCLQAPFQSNSICVGQKFFARDSKGSFLRIGNDLTIDLDQATEWKPPTVLPKDIQSLAMVKLCTRRLLQTVSKFGSAKGLGHTIPLISAFTDGSEMPTSGQDLLVSTTRNSILGLATACFTLDMKEGIKRGRELVGLGPGLTPSGDDFLGGLLFTAHSLKAAYPQEFNWEDQLISDLINWAYTQTHPISHALLKDHALGYGSEPLHQVVTSLLSDADLDQTMEAASRLLGIGDTSGWDMLAGMLTGMLLVEGKVILQVPDLKPMFAPTEG